MSYSIEIWVCLKTYKSANGNLSGSLELKLYFSLCFLYTLNSVDVSSYFIT